jgi:hypothetical protein
LTAAGRHGSAGAIAAFIRRKRTAPARHMFTIDHLFT